jgi:hypothetical protein
MLDKINNYGKVISGLQGIKKWVSGHTSKMNLGVMGRAGAGAVVSSAMGFGPLPGAVAGAASPIIGRGIRGMGSQLKKGFTASPVRTGAALGLTLGVMGAGMALGTRTLNQLRTNMRPTSGVGPSMTSSGYVSWTNGRSEGMSAEHLGASGGLSLALHRTRHRLNLHRTGFS